VAIKRTDRSRYVTLPHQRFEKNKVIGIDNGTVFYRRIKRALFITLWKRLTVRQRIGESLAIAREF